jgi:hypothetical protein
MLDYVGWNLKTTHEEVIGTIYLFYIFNQNGNGTEVLKLFFLV